MTTSMRRRPHSAASRSPTCRTTAAKKSPTQPLACCSRCRAGLPCTTPASVPASAPGQYTQFVPRHRLRGRVFGIVGLGRIGSAVALRAKALGMDVAYYDPYKPDGYDKALGVRRVEDLPSLLANRTSAASIAR